MAGRSGIGSWLSQLRGLQRAPPVASRARRHYLQTMSFDGALLVIVPPIPAQTAS
jgi:hypothetical protein